MRGNVDGRGGIKMLVAVAVVIIAVVAFFILSRKVNILEGNLGYGSLICPISDADSGKDTNCFLLTNGWDKYYKMSNLFIGPNVVTDGISSGILTNMLLNPKKCTHLYLSTCLPTNGGELATGIYIQLQANANEYHYCFTNKLPCSCGGYLTIADIPLSNDKDFKAATYGAGVYFKSNTANKLTNIIVYWSYTN